MSATCEVCKHPLAATAVWTCPECESQAHQDCAEFVGQCPVYACPGVPGADPPDGAAPDAGRPPTVAAAVQGPAAARPRPPAAAGETGRPNPAAPRPAAREPADRRRRTHRHGRGRRPPGSRAPAGLSAAVVLACGLGTAFLIQSGPRLFGPRSGLASARTGPPPRAEEGPTTRAAPGASPAPRGGAPGVDRPAAAPPETPKVVREKLAARLARRRRREAARAAAGLWVFVIPGLVAVVAGVLGPGCLRACWLAGAALGYLGWLFVVGSDGALAEPQVVFGLLATLGMATGATVSAGSEDG